MGQAQVASSRAESYTWGVEIECFLPQATLQVQRHLAEARAPPTSSPDSEAR
jgi:hypothetical protein